MTTKTINGAYPGGYYLKPAYTTLDIGASAVIGGSGIRASSGQATTIDNYGTIAPTGAGIVLLDGGAVTNAASGLISGGIAISGQPGSVSNAGTISGNSYSVTSSGTVTLHQEASVLFTQGGTVFNAARGDLTNGVSVQGVAGTIVNYGSIGGPQTAVVTSGHTVTTTYASVDLLHGGSVSNGSATDTTAALEQGISLVGTGTITNFGVIGSTSAGMAAYLAGPDDVFIEEGCGVIEGSISNSGASFSDVLDLAAGGGAGTITGLGETITGFQTTNVESGSSWTFSGSNTITGDLTNAAAIIVDGSLTNNGGINLGAALQLATNAALDNSSDASITLYAGSGILAVPGATNTTLVNAGRLFAPGGASPDQITANTDNTGTVFAEGGVLDINGAVSGSGDWEVSAGTNLDFHDAVATGATIAFMGENGLVSIGDGAGFAGTIANFASSRSLDVSGAAIDLSAIPFSADVTLAWSGTNSSGVLTVTSGAQIANIAFAGQYNVANFKAASDGASGVDISFVTATKTITGVYSGGYYLKPIYDALTIAASGGIDGGLGVSLLAPSTIDNLGHIGGAYLLDGGILFNGSSANAGASSGPVHISYGTLINYGGISAPGESSVVPYPSLGYRPPTSGEAGVYINGSVTNTGDISGATLSVKTNEYYCYYFFSTRGVGISSSSSVNITNGSAIHTSAEILGIEANRATIINYGFISAVTIRGFYDVLDFHYARRPLGDMGFYAKEQYAITLAQGGMVTNGTAYEYSATITAGVKVTGAPAVITNFGQIGGPAYTHKYNTGETPNTTYGYSVFLADSGSVTNGGPTDARAGLSNGVLIDGLGTMTNFGSVGTTSSGISVDLVGAGSLLIDEATGVFGGRVIATDGSLDLAPDSETGTISGLGSTIAGFATIAVEAGGAWTFTNDSFAGVTTFTDAGSIVLLSGSEFDAPHFTLIGSGAIVADAGATGEGVHNGGVLERAAGSGASDIEVNVDNTGRIVDAGGGLNIVGTVTGSGAWDIGAGASLSFRYSFAAGGDVAFTGANGTLLLEDAAAFAGSITNFGGGGETIDLSSIAFGSGVSLGWSGGPSGGTLTVTSGLEVAAIAFAGHYASGSFQAASDGSSGTDITFVEAIKTISTGYAGGYALAAGHYLTITSTGSIGGGLTAGSSAIVVNGGAIAGGSTKDGVSFSGAGTLINQAGASISGRDGVFDGSAGLTITNFGSISGTSAALSLTDDRLIEEGSGVLTGKVLGGGGTLELAAAAGTGTISGLGSTITGFSTIEVDVGAGWHLAGVNRILAGETLRTASAIAVANAGELVNEGVIGLGALVQIGQSGLLDNLGQVLIGADVSLSQAAGTTGARLINAGLLEKSGGTGVSKIAVDLTDTGTIAVDSGTIDIAGAVNTISGTVNGTGLVEFDGGATTVKAGAALDDATEILGTGTTLTLATSLTLDHGFEASGANTLAIDTDDTFTLTHVATFTDGTVDGGGHLVTSATTEVSDETLGGKAEWLNSGGLTDTGVLTVGDAVTTDKALFINEAGSGFDLSGAAADIDAGASTSDELENAGLLERTGAVGTSVIAPRLVNTGTIEAATGTIDITGIVSGSGLSEIRAGATLEFASTVGAGGLIDLDGSKAVLLLADAAGFKSQIEGFASGRTIDLRGGGFAPGATLSYSGTSTSGTLTVRDGSSVARIALLGQYAAANFKTASDGSGGLDITFAAAPAPAPAPALAFATPGH